MKLPYHHLTCGDWWDEDRELASYNKFQHVACGGHRRSPAAARRSGVRPRSTASSPSWNTTHPDIPGRGSAIFLHVDTETRQTAVSPAPARTAAGCCAGSAGGDDPHRSCINALTKCILCGMQTAAILGCAGYAGQETLDRLLAHPALEAIALGSDSLAGQPAQALDPRLDGSLPAFVPNAEAAASGADVLFLCLDNDEAPPFSRPPTRSSSTCPAPTGSAIRTSHAPGTARRPARGATACRSSIRPRAC